SNRDKLTILFEQIQLDEADKENYFSTSVLEKLIVHKTEKIWHFHITVDQVIPFSVYYTILTSLQKHFEQIATTKLTFKQVNENVQVEHENLEQYWIHFIKTHENLLDN